MDKGTLDLVGSRIVHIQLSLDYKLININSISSHPFLQHSCCRNSREYQGKFFAFANMAGKMVVNGSTHPVSRKDPASEITALNRAS